MDCSEEHHISSCYFESIVGIECLAASWIITSLPEEETNCEDIQQAQEDCLNLGRYYTEEDLQAACSSPHALGNN